MNGHIGNSATGTPTVSGTGCGSATIVGNDTRGTVSGMVSGNCTLTFSTAYTSAPYCVAIATTAAASITVGTPTTTTVPFKSTTTAGFTYICMQ